MRKRRSLAIERLTGRLPALALAGALCLVVTSPALANFESAVAAYENGAYQDAQAEFEALADAGDGRATPYLERIREKLRQDRQAGGAGTSTFVDSIASIFEESGTAGDSSPSSTASRNTEPSAANRGPAAAPGETSPGGQPWSAFDTRIEPAPLPVSDVATPERRSVWSTLFHLPGDATVVGLQYVARFLDADTLSRELQRLGGQSDRIALSILAGFWWLIIVKVLVGIGLAIGRVMKAATILEEHKRYG